MAPGCGARPRPACAPGTPVVLHRGTAVRPHLACGETVGCTGTKLHPNPTINHAG